MIDGNIRLAIAVKKSSDLDDIRTVEKLEIEHRYWMEQGIEWVIITELDFEKARVANVRWVHEMRKLDGLDVPYPEFWQDRCEQLRCLGRKRKYNWDRKSQVLVKKLS